MCKNRILAASAWLIDFDMFRKATNFYKFDCLPIKKTDV